MSLITLTTDFGLKDGFVGAMKGVIWGIAPQAQIADISHQVSPQNIREAGLILARVAPYYSPGSIHVVVVDPGVGTQRRGLLACLGAQFYVGPDNGAITAWLATVERQGAPVCFYNLDRPAYWLPNVTHVFHGRDIFAPAAAHLAAGVSPEDLGAPIDDPVRLTLPQPQRTTSGWQGEVMHIDHFGNLITNLDDGRLAGAHIAVVRLKGAEIPGLVKTFGERPIGTLAAMIGSSGTLVVAEVNGNAAARLNARVSDAVEVVFG
jgi:S-adenosylmethionine hydrolase